MKLICDLCGGSLEMKNGSAVCQNCGLTYSIETLREKMGKTAQAPATTTAHAKTTEVDSAQYTNLMNLAVSEFNGKNYEKAIAICDQVLASDYSNKDAWQIKIRSSNVEAAIAAYQAYYASQQTEESRAQSASFGMSYFSTQKMANIEAQKALLAVFPVLANQHANNSILNRLSGMKDNISEITAAQNWEKSHKPSSDCQENEKTIQLRGKLCDRLRWVDGDIGCVEDYHSFSILENSDINESLITYCDALVKWMTLIKDFKRWDGEYHHRETSGYSTTCYYHNYKLIPLFYDTSWEYCACDRYIKSINAIRNSVAKQNAAKIAQRAAEERKRVTAYWAAHPKEKQELETARAALEKQISHLKEAFRNSEEVRLMNTLEDNLKQLQTQRTSLGLFSFKEKKALNAQIDTKEIEIKLAKKKCDEIEHQKNNQIKELKLKIQKINDRLNLIVDKYEL